VCKKRHGNSNIFLSDSSPPVILSLPSAPNSCRVGHPLIQRIMAISMKVTSTGAKLSVLIAILVIIALLIDLFFFTRAGTREEAKLQEQRQGAAVAEAKQAAIKLAQEKKVAEQAQQQAAKDAEAQAGEARKKATEDTAAEHARLLERYLNSRFTSKPGVAIIGVAIESETGTINPTISHALAQRLESGDVQLLNSFFKPDFVADRFVASIFSGDTGIFDRLELTNWLNGVLIGRQTITYSKNTALDSTITANLRLQVMVLPVGLARDSQSWALSANGVGFNENDARLQAEDRIIHRIESDSTMSLSTFGTKK
jgi:hypothetical protein